MAERPEHSAEDATSPADFPAVGAQLAVYTAIDACRPGSEDLERELPTDVAAQIRRSEPSAARYRAVQRFDHALASAFAEVPIPSSLADRLLAALAEQQAEVDATKPAANGNTAPVELRREPAPSSSIPTAPLSRRRWLELCGGALAATAAGVGFLWWRRANDQPELTLDDVLEQALHFNESSEARLTEAIPVTREPAPAEFPLSRRLVGLRDVVRWRRLDGRFLGREGVAYELGPIDRSATLYVLAEEGRRGSAPITSLPEEPLNPHTTGGFTLAGWRELERIQILVVAGDADRFRSLLTSPREVA